MGLGKLQNLDLASDFFKIGKGDSVSFTKMAIGYLPLLNSMLNLCNSFKKKNLLLNFGLLNLVKLKNSKKTMKRITLYASDLVLITGKSGRTCQRIFQQIRDTFGIKKNQVVTVYHVSDFLGLPLEQVNAFIR